MVSLYECQTLIIKGNYDGLGQVRELELVRSCVALGMKPEHVVVLDDS